MGAAAWDGRARRSRHAPMRADVGGRPKGRPRRGKVPDDTAGHGSGGRVERGREGRWKGQGGLVAVDGYGPGEQLGTGERDGPAVKASSQRGFDSPHPLQHNRRSACCFRSAGRRVWLRPITRPTVGPVADARDG
jgi:hypothetical protein